MKNLSLENCNVLGKEVVHDSAIKHTTGQAIYVDDICDYPHQLYACFLLSKEAHALIIEIDTTAAKKMVGVVDVICAKDVVGKLDIGAVFGGDPLLADKKVEFVGQPLAAVAAKSMKIARNAVQTIKVKYQPLSAVLSIKEALAKKSFVLESQKIQTGDANQAIKNAKHTLSGELSIGGQDHFYLETQVSLSVPQEDGILVYSSTQNPTETQKMVASVLNLSMKQVVVETRRMGGGFGGKETQSSGAACISALFAYRNQMPVKMRLSRFDDMTTTGKRHSFENSYLVGFDDNGVIQGIKIKLSADCGYSPDLSAAIMHRAILHSDNCYYLKNIEVVGYLCKTNKVSNTAFRGFGGPQGMLTIEQVIDEIARYLEKDAVDVRLANIYLKNNTTHYGQKITENTAKTLITQILISSDYKQRRKKIQVFNQKNNYQKKGIALSPVKFGISFTVKFLNQAGALIHIYTDGSIHLNHGGTEMGQGLLVKVAQVVASEFQVPLSAIQITATRTDKVPNTSATAASSGSDLNAAAAQIAAKTIKKKLISFAAEYFQTSPQSIYFENAMLVAGSKKIPFNEFILLAYENRIALSSTGFYTTPKIYFDEKEAKGRPFFYFSYGVAVSEVIVDILTGEYQILRVDILHDVGNSINPAMDLGQVEGGFIQGLGWLTTEELSWNENGKLHTAGPDTYKIPTIGNLPEDFRVTLYRAKNQEDTIYRSKAVGEPPLMLANSIWLAIKDVVSNFANGKRVDLKTPATPVEVLRAITKLKTE